MLKKMIRYCLPPVFFLLKERLFTKPPEFEGLFETFDETRDDSYAGNIWKNTDWWAKQLKKIKGFNELFESYDRGSLVNYSPLGGNLGSLMLLMNVMSMNKNAVKVLDFGGGTGLLYHASMCNAINPDNIEWFVCDNDSLAELGREHIHCDFSKIHYTSTFEDFEYDVLMVSSTLHYIEDYRKVLRSLLRCTPSVVHLERLHAGDITDNYVSLQRQRPLLTPILTPIMNAKLSDITSLLYDLGYKLVYKANNENELYNEDSFSAEIPADQRINFSINLTFIHPSASNLSIS